MKKLLNNPEDVVEEMLQGIVYAHGDKLKRVEGFNVITRKESGNKVGIVSGGGSGHEPAHAGFVGKGMLDAAVSGNVFASPSPDQIIEGIKAADNGKGVLLVVKNYSGDVMNFEMATELAEMEGIETASVVVGDDVAVENSTYTTGRRGIVGTLFVHKIAGAAAEKGAELSEVERIAKKVVDNVRSMGMSLTPCINPAVGKPGFDLGEKEMGIGIGIHGEPGVCTSEIKTADETAEILVNKILEDIDYKDSELGVIINGLGATPLMELYIVNRKVVEILEEKNIKIHKTFVGNYMTALDMAGCTISILKLDNELKELLDYPCDAPALVQK
jgi:dihydroxyacetone kinase-like protein